MPKLQIGQTALLVVDVQEKLQPHMHNADELLRQTGRLIDVAGVLEVPIVVTEQYRKGLGLTHPALSARFTSTVSIHEKLKFSACIEPVRQQLQRRAARSVLVCGIEAHVCVLLTCLDLVDSGFVTAVAVDAIGSRRPGDQQAAVTRMTQAGVIPTTVESAAFELLHKAGGERFKAVLNLIK